MSVPCSTAEVGLPSFLPAHVMVVFLSQFEPVWTTGALEVSNT
jgi:hypothetical protein